MKIKDKKSLIVLCSAIIIVALLVVVSSILYEFGWTKIVRNLILAIALVPIAMIDKEEKRIPNKAILGLLIARAVLLIIELVLYSEVRLALLTSVGLGFLLGGGILLIAYAVSRGGIGMGDVKLFAVVGAYVGSHSVAACLLFSMTLAAIYSCVMMLRKKLTAKDEIPLGPFAAVGTIIAIIIGA